MGIDRDSQILGSYGPVAGQPGGITSPFGKLRSCVESMIETVYTVNDVTT